MTQTPGGDRPDDGYVGRHYAHPPPPAFPPPRPAAQANDPWAGQPPAAQTADPPTAQQGAPWPPQTSADPWQMGPRSARRRSPVGCSVGAGLLVLFPIAGVVISALANFSDNDFRGEVDFGEVDLGAPVVVQTLAPGESVDYPDYGGEPVGTLTLEEIDLDYACDGFLEDPPLHGRYVGLRLSVTADLGEDPLYLFDTGITVADTDGEVLEADKAYGCAATELEPSTEPGQRQTGWLVLDTEEEVDSALWDLQYGQLLVEIDLSDGGQAG